MWFGRWSLTFSFPVRNHLQFLLFQRAEKLAEVAALVVHVGALLSIQVVDPVEFIRTVDCPIMTLADRGGPVGGV